MALRAAGCDKDQPRVAEAVRMLLDRQLPDGGWNYGNTVVFGQKLYPMPDMTGMALSALSGLVSYVDVAKSVEYLRAEAPGLRTPFSLGWCLLGLGSWGSRPSEAEALILNCLARQGECGPYDTIAYSLLVSAFLKPRGLSSPVE
jgi:hypothetical protein